MYVLQGKELVIHSSEPLRQLIPGKWYAYAQGQGYSDYVLVRKNEQNELTLIHAWLKEASELGFYSLTLTEVLTDKTIPVITLRSGLQTIDSDYANRAWEDLSVPEIYEDLYLEMYEDYMAETMILAAGCYFDYQLVDVYEVKDVLIQASDIQQLENH